MADDQDQEKELPASERRLQQARDEGNVPRSREFSGGAILFATFVYLLATGPWVMSDMQDLLRLGLRLTSHQAHDVNAMLHGLKSACFIAMLLLLPFMAINVFLTVACNVSVGGWVMASKLISPDFTRLNPARGLANMLSINALVELCKALLKTVVLGFVAYLIIKGHLEEFSSMIAMPLMNALVLSFKISLMDALILSAVFFLLVSADIPYQLWRYYKGLRMSLEELKREAKETEGDPYIKGKIRSLQREAARKRMMAAIPSADVVVTNPTHYAVALKYHDAKAAPQVVAKGTGELAFKIRELAGLNRVPVLEVPPLARALYRHVELDEVIPKPLYIAVAKLLAYVYALNDSRHADFSQLALPGAEDIPPGFDPGATEEPLGV